MALKIDMFPCREDNYGVIIHDPTSGDTALIDAPDEGAILAAVARTGWTPTMILTTHHHVDHVEANLPLKRRFDLTIFGPYREAHRIPGIDETLGDGEFMKFGDEQVEVIETPGHTAGHICFHFPKSKVAFTADTLFALGCGRLFECGPAEMHASLGKLAALLPLDTTVYCGHEYTLSNARFALTIDPTNSALKERAAEIESLRADGRPALPTTMALEMATNPFLRAHDPVIRRNLGMEDASDVEVFAEIRKRKDVF